MHLFAVIALLATFHYSECLVEFTHSAIFDEYDFEGQSKVEIKVCSNTTRCALFVAIYPSAFSSDDDIYHGIKLSTESRAHNTSIAELSELRNWTTFEMVPYFIADDLAKPEDKLWFFNDNYEGISDSLVIYAVDISEDQNWSKTSGVFDAYSLYPGVTRGKIVTILSGKPFTVNIAGDKNSMATVYTAGFDNAFESPDECRKLFQTKFDEVVSFQINGPIASLFFSDYQGQLIDSSNRINATQKFVYDLHYSSYGFVTSEGFIGCKQGQAYRSRFYQHQIFFSLNNDIYFHDVHLHAAIVTDAAHPLKLYIGSIDVTDNLLGESMMQTTEMCNTTREFAAFFEQTSLNSFALVYEYGDKDCKGNPIVTTAKPTTLTTTTTVKAVQTTTTVPTTTAVGKLTTMTEHLTTVSELSTTNNQKEATTSSTVGKN